MNIINILDEIEKVDADVYDRLNPRRAAMKDFFSVGKKVAAASVPFAIGAMFKKAYAQSAPSDAIVGVLQFALALEHFESAFYVRGFNEAGFNGTYAAADKTAIGIIRDHEANHVKFLQSVLTGAGKTPVTPKTYDFTAGGTFPNTFANYPTFLAVAQALEDTGVRAYKGAAPTLIRQSVYLTAALNIHSVEARHAAKIRYMRLLNGHSTTIKPWISGNDNTTGTPTAGVYAGEENVMQAGLPITAINGTGVTAAAASESFDEPLTADQVTQIVRPFGVTF